MNPYEIEDLRFRYRGGFSLEIASFRLEAGERLAVVGRNGSGKTTFLRVLSFLERPHSWRVFRHWGVDVRRGRFPRTDLGVLRQHPWIFRGTVADNLAFPLAARGFPREVIPERVGEMARRLDLLDRLGASARSLSGGEQRRLALGRVLIAEPRVLLLDEPTAHLDGRSLAIVAGILSRSDAALLMTTHDPSFALSTAGRVLVLDHGHMEGGPPSRPGAMRAAAHPVPRLPEGDGP